MTIASPSLPPARIARQGGAEVAPPRVPLRNRFDPLLQVLGYLVAFWPLTATILVCAALIWAAGYNASP